MATSLSIDATVSRYREMATAWYIQTPSARSAFDEFLQFYRDVRVDGTSLEEDGDELVIEFGPTRKLGIDEFRDFRFDETDDADGDEQYLCLSLSRTVYPYSLDNMDADFDHDSIEFALCLFFARATGDEEFHTAGGSTPEEVTTDVLEFETNQVIKEMLTQMPVSIEAYVGGGG
jgi:hypothetical protein